MSEDPRVDRLERVVWTLIAWIAQHATTTIRVDEARALFEMLAANGRDARRREILRDSTGTTRTRRPWDGRSYDDRQVQR